MKEFFLGNEGSVALEVGSSRYTYSEIQSKAQELELLYSQTFNQGERIFISSENIFLFVSSIFAFQKIGLVCCCWNGYADIKKLSKLVSASGYIEIEHDTGGIICKKLRTDAALKKYPGDFVITTSGSTGEPKGVLLFLKNIIDNAEAAGKSIGFNEYNLEKWCVNIDFSLMSAISHLFMAWHAGIPLRSIKDDSNVCVSEQFKTQKIGFGGAPYQLSRLAQDVEQFHDGCLLVSSGDFLSRGVIKEILDRHKTLSICTFYGLTELSGRFCYMSARDTLAKPGAAGRPIIESSLRVEKKNDYSEIIAKSPYLFSGYFRNNGFFEKALDEFATGDSAQIDEEGYVWLTGRVNDTFKVSGEKVNRKKIEESLLPLLKNYEFCILPVEHHIMGTCCALFVEINNDKEIVPLKEIVLAIRAKLSTNCIPVYSYILDSMPRLDNGKLDKQHLINEHTSFDRYK